MLKLWVDQACKFKLDLEPDYLELKASPRILSGGLQVVTWQYRLDAKRIVVYIQARLNVQA
jgi:hypothetical protein